MFGILAGLAYAGYLSLMRVGSGIGSAAIPVCLSTTSTAVVAAVIGGLWGGVDPTPPWGALGWLTALALIGQVLAWLVITAALPRLQPSVSATLLLLHPALAILIGFGIGERPTVMQLIGCAVVIGTVWFTTRQGPSKGAALRTR
ncbi:DMT family transporter [Streptomyces sp. NBC_01235]|uniref:DMT family transporter n=1 Tax=Streptomyces sp. NBC_01235 TaxID=2903788 RepID=UPI002E132916|nr:DMT family transporter [Streptomyces sp. NBC_01235]